MKQNDIIREEDIRRDNHRAYWKYRWIVAVACIFGALLGVLIGVVRVTPDYSDQLEKLMESLAEVYGSWCGVLMLAVSPAACLLAVLPYRKAKALQAQWDEEDEAMDQQIHLLLRQTLLASNVGMILVTILLGVSVSLPEEVLRIAETRLVLYLSVTLVWSSVLQRKAVDLVRRLNPEKQGSVYDIHFQKMWYASCDEAERQQIGEASRFACQTMNSIACPVVFLAATLFSMLFHTGPLAVLLVGALWLTQTLCYQLRAMQLRRAANGGQRT